MEVEDNGSEKLREEEEEEEYKLTEEEEEEEEEGESHEIYYSDYGEGRIYGSEITASSDVFQGERDEQDGSSAEHYTEGGKYYLIEPSEPAEHLSIWEEGDASVSSERTLIVSEVEETEEEKELRRERESLIEAIRQKVMDRILLRRRNVFLHKKLIEHFKKRRMENVLKEEPKGLDLESKYLKRLYAYQEFKIAQKKERDELTAALEQFEMDTKQLEEELNEKFKSLALRAKEVSLNLISTKTGKKINEKTVDRLLRRYLQKSEEKGRRKLVYIKIKNLIEEKDAQLKNMEYFGEGLHIVDYEQMKIDNQNYTDKIEEKEDELTKMRLKTQGIILKLTNVREKIYAIEGDIELMEEKVFEVEMKFIETRERLTKSRKRRDSLRDELARLKSVSGLLTRDALLRDFESSIIQGKNLTKNLEKMKKVINEKKKQENELAKVLEGSNYETFIPNEVKALQKSKSRLYTALT